MLFRSLSGHNRESPSRINHVIYEENHSIPDNVTTDDTGRVSDILLLSHAVQEILLFRGVAGLLNGLDTRDPQGFCELSCKVGHEVRVSTARDGNDAIDAFLYTNN